MTDVHTKEQRRRNMQAIRNRDTKPEIAVRQIAHRLGFRFRLHRRTLPGTPDLVFPRHWKVIEVMGCYWHKHSCPNGQVIPKSNREFWEQKRKANVLRDIANRDKLERMGWARLDVWECEVRADRSAVAEKIRRFLKGEDDAE